MPKVILFPFLFNEAYFLADIPLGDLPNCVEEIDDELPIYVMCRRGIASQKAAKILRESGIRNVKDIVGGITEWSKSVDPSMPSY